MPRGIYNRKRKPGRPAKAKERMFTHQGSLYSESELQEEVDDGEVVYEVVGRYVIRTKAFLEKTELKE